MLYRFDVKKPKIVARFKKPEFGLIFKIRVKDFKILANDFRHNHTLIKVVIGLSNNEQEILQETTRSNDANGRARLIFFNFILFIFIVL